MADSKTTLRDGFVERRKYKRLLFETFGAVRLGGRGDLNECYIQNIGTGGARLYVTGDCPVGEKIHLEFSIGNRDFKKDGAVIDGRAFSETRKYILKVGKSLHFTNYLNVSFAEPLESSDFEFIKLNYI